MIESKNKNLERYSDLLDTKFRIPGTDIRFGLDFIIGLIPGAGDIISFILSAGLLLAMVWKGASGKALGWMIINIILDTTLGSLPVVGDIFDLFFKANKRNLDLFQEHFEEGKYKGSAWPFVWGILIVLLILLILVGYIIYLLIDLIYQLII